ncbi:MAG: potassium channel protein [Desulfobacteraceae bacterium]
MERIQQILISISLSIILLAIGSGGYMAIEGWGFLDALYMTVITLATVGYGEVHSVSAAGRIFTLVLILLGVGYFLYVVGNIIQFLVEGRIRLVLGRHKLDKQINRLKNHYIICGYGRMGRELAGFLIQRYLDLVVIEQNEKRAEIMNSDGILYLIGQATDKEMLTRAGIQRAQGFITAVGTDADNVFLVLIARQMNPQIHIVARAIQNATKETLMAAGANRVISPYTSGARLMSHAVLRPTVLSFFDMAFADESTDIQVEEVSIKSNSELVDKTLIESGIRQKFDLIVLLIKKQDDAMLFNPGANTRLEINDTVVVVGSLRSIQAFERMLAPS